MDSGVRLDENQSVFVEGAPVFNHQQESTMQYQEAPKHSPDSQVHLALGRLHAQASQARDVVYKLIERLEPAMRPAGIHPSGETASQSAVAQDMPAPLVAQIDDLTHFMGRMHEDLMTIERRLAL